MSFRCSSLTLALTVMSVLDAAAQTPPARRADTVVRIASAPLHRGVATLREDLSIGVPTGAPEYMFGEIADVAVSADGSMLILDRKGQIVRKYDPSGKFVRTLGRRGQGPGEHLVVSGVSFLPDGRALVWDTGNWRVNVYSPLAEYESAWPVPVSGSQSSSTARGLVVDSAGNAYARRFAIDRQKMASIHYWVRIGPDGTVRDTLMEPVVSGPDLGLEAIAPGGQARAKSTLPFSAEPLISLSPKGYFVTGHPSRYAFEIVRRGHPILSVRRPDARPDPVSAHERDSARTEVLARMRRVDPSWTWNGPDIPGFKPFYTRLFIGADGRIWVPLVRETLPRLGAMMGPGRVGVGPPRGSAPASTPTPLSDAKIPVVYDVFEPTGIYVGQVGVPPRHVLAVTRGDQLWAVAYDDDDVASVKRFRIVWK